VVHDADDIIVKAVDEIKSVEIVEGNGGPGTIKKLNFVEGKFTYIHFYKLMLIS
jgi:hypothetical protein